MPRPKNSTFADSAIHGPNASLPRHLQAARRAWLGANRERESQLDAIATDGQDCAQPVMGKGRGAALAPMDQKTNALDADHRLQQQMEFGPRLAPHVPPKRVR